MWQCFVCSAELNPEHTLTVYESNPACLNHSIDELKAKHEEKILVFAIYVFLEAVALENKMRDKKQMLGLKLDFFLSRAGKPLSEAFIPHDQLKLALDLDDECSGYCWT